MTAHRIILEQFAVAPPCPADSEAGHDLPAMDDPIIRPAVPEVEDAGAGEIAALREELTAGCNRLAEIIATVAAERSAEIAAATEAAAARVAAVGADILGHVVRDGFEAEIAAAVADIAGRIPGADATLGVAAEDHELLAELIAASQVGATITIVTDDRLAPGQVRMRWPDGGADFDAEDLSGRIAPLIAERLSDLKPREAP